MGWINGHYSYVCLKVLCVCDLKCCQLPRLSSVTDEWKCGSLPDILTYSMEQRTSWKANRSSASQEIPCILWKLKVHYCIQNSLPPVPILSQINPIRDPHPSSLRPILILSFHLRLALPSGLHPSGFPTKTPYEPLLYPILATCPAHLSLLDMITQMIFSEECRA
jgi:hypothetical protein